MGGHLNVPYRTLSFSTTKNTQSTNQLDALPLAQVMVAAGRHSSVGRYLGIVCYLLGTVPVLRPQIIRGHRRLHGIS